MRPGVPGQLQLNPFKVRLASMHSARFGGFPKVAGLYPGLKMGGGMGGMMPKMGGGMGGLGGGIPGLGMPKMRLR